MRLYGLDGCRAGWVAASAPVDDPAAIHIAVIPRLAILFEGEAPGLAGIDMTIGLPERIGPEGRVPERLIRQVLGPRRSSVFSTPCRAAVYAGDYTEACRLARAHSDPPRALSKQAFNILPKMREIDALLGARPGLRPLLREVHPETSFWALNGKAPMAHAKKTAEGVAERHAVLRRCGVPAAALATRLKGATADDVVDALAVLQSAFRVWRGEAVVFGADGDADAFGFPCAISA
ncbi:MAG: DUF429 domain-containing protein [Alphaproteobacteria bacterium]|nr:DUF429 domain-containing protein [Alphaproteobacteria bacterium]